MSILLAFLFGGVTDHSVSLSSLFSSVLSEYFMYCSSDVMDVRGTSLRPGDVSLCVEVHTSPVETRIELQSALLTAAL